MNKKCYNYKYFLILLNIMIFICFSANCKSVLIPPGKDDTTKKVHATVYGCMEGNCADGVGTYTWENGSKYTGEFKKGSMHGQGTFYFGAGNAGAKYEGEFKNGFIDGIGTWTWANGEKYTGESKFNKMHGKGTYYYPDGTVKQGTWYNDKYIGE